MIEVKCVRNREDGGNMSMCVSGDLPDILVEFEEIVRGFYTGLENSGLPAATLLKGIVVTVIKKERAEG